MKFALHISVWLKVKSHVSGACLRVLDSLLLRCTFENWPCGEV